MKRLLLILLTMAIAVPAYAELRAGAAKRSIVPPFPTHMGGFGDRMQTVEGVHDEIFARALVLDNGETQLAIIGSDLMAFDEDLTAGVREQVSAATGIPPEHIMVSCTHNHSAPSYYQYDEGDLDRKKARDFMVTQFADAAIEAYKNREPAELGYANGAIEGATRNRQQDNDTTIDTQVGVLRVEKLEGREIIAVLWNFTGHPVILGSRNLELSGEWPGAASRTIEAVLGGVAVPTQGACGDITVHREGDPFLEVERLGRLVAGEVIKTAEAIRPDAEATLAAAATEFPLKPKEVPTTDETSAALESAEAVLKAAEESEAPAAIVRQYENQVRMWRAFDQQASGIADGSLERPETYPGSVQVMQIDDVVLVGVPCELFVEYALEMRQRIAQITGYSTCVIGYANGYIGYVVTPRARETGGYEVSVQRAQLNTGRIMTERALQLVHRFVQ